MRIIGPPQAALDTLIARLNVREAQIKATTRAWLALIKQQGDDLIELKQTCRHGQFQKVVGTRLAFSYSSATDYMKIARNWRKIGRAQGLVSIRQALSLIEVKKPASPLLSERARSKIATLADSPSLITREFPRRNSIKLIWGDCLKMMHDIAARSVDLILCDLPYGISALDWDQPLDLSRLWKHYKRIIKPNCPVVLFASQPFTSELVLSNREWFRYDMIWVKTQGTGFVHAKHRPMKKHEEILVFSEGTIGPRSKNRMPYYPQGLIPTHNQEIIYPKERRDCVGYQTRWQRAHRREFSGYPTSILEFRGDRLGVHSVGKPIKLLEFLIETYSRPGNLVLDNAMGSGTTGMACANTGRRFIGIEKDKDIFQTARQMILAMQIRPASDRGRGWRPVEVSGYRMGSGPASGRDGVGHRTA
jgi:site-specific DNA-methyltransferase (adenine-specific)